MQELWYKFIAEENFLDAWKKVRMNMGSPGIDGLSIGNFESNIDYNLSLLRELVRQGNYQPLPLLKREIPKENGKERIIKIPAIRDRIVQTALLNVIQPEFEKTFFNCSYGYRPGKSALMAVKRVDRNIRRGLHWIIDADIEKFFDTVNHKILIAFLEEKISDSRIINLIKNWINFNEETSVGLPQGMVLSPILANIYLNILDREMIRVPGHYVRFCDDFVVLCKTEEDAKDILKKIKFCLENQLVLKLNNEKTRICHINEGFVFLGFYFNSSGRRPCHGAMEKLQTKIKKEIETSPMDKKLIEKIKSIIRGWQNYFQLEGYEQDELFVKIDEIIKSKGESIPISILKAGLYLQKDERQKAYDIIHEKSEILFEDSEICFQWGVINEALGLDDDARDSYYNALRLNPEHQESLFWLGKLMLKKNNIEKAIHFLQKASLLVPDNPEIFLHLGLALEKWGLNGAAKKAFSRAKELDNSVELPTITKTDVADETKDIDRISFNESDLELFLRLFSGREGVFAKQWVDATGKTGYYPVNSPLTRDDVKLHLEGKITVGLYITRMDNTVKCAVIDIDITKKSLGEKIQGGIDLYELVLNDARNIVNFLQNLGIPSYIEKSGWKGIHCWIFFDRPVRAKEVRIFLKELLKKIGPPPAQINREIFPKQDYIEKESLGCLIKLPLGIHQMTHKRSLFIDLQGNPYENQIGILWKIQKVENEVLLKAISQLRLHHEKEEKYSQDMTLVKQVVDKCNILKYLTKKAEMERNLSHSERLVLLHTLGHLGEQGREAIHDIIGKCFNYSYERTSKWFKRINPYPISCPRIREWLCHITPVVGCYCEFPTDIKHYPTPLLHAGIIPFDKKQQEIKLEPSSDDSKEILVKSVSKELKNENEKTVLNYDIDQLIDEYLELKKRKKEIEAKISSTAQKLNEVFKLKGVESIELKMGILKKVQNKNTVQFVIEI